MKRDALFLLKPDFMDGGEGPFVCRESMALEGLLSYYPSLRSELDIRYVDFPRPRVALVDLLSEAHQEVPVLILGSGRAARSVEAKVAPASGKRFIDEGPNILEHLIATYRLARLHRRSGGSEGSDP